jgi:hypothetical protein
LSVNLKAGVRNMLAYITTLTDEELDAVAAGATVTWRTSATATGLTKASINVSTKASATTTKTSEAAAFEEEGTVETA